MTTTDELPGRRPEPEAPARSGYGGMWRDVPRAIGFLILGLPIAIASIVVLSTLFFAGLGTLVIVVGVFVVVGALYTARAFGTFELVRLRWAGRPPIRRPAWARAETQGFWRTVAAPFVDGHYWLYLLHGLIIGPIIGIFSWSVTIVWLTGAVGGLTSWIWDRGFMDEDGLYGPLPGFLGFDGPVFDVLAGVFFVLTMPVVFRGLVRLHDLVARGMLGSWRSEALAVEVRRLDASRGAAVEAEDLALRRLERDIHDGPQQRLVRLQMDLAAAERRLDADDAQAARDLLGEARTQTAEALDELRALSRGFAPPILQDRGLAAALESLAARSPVPVTFENLVPVDAGLPPSLERNAYFIAAELLTNAAKHAGASAVRLVVAVRGEAVSHWLDLWVTDNGRGGAAAVPGHGLAGLDERVRGLRGVLRIDSPAGGPTIVGAHLPY
ncbi:sensor histidine kinase [Agromyces archimandritae]|uniref:histidine kinase n=1 Tax=Agromyces archimandritae TaxID=2781962 RepID=A0A975FMR9_9MICO|nr:sensor histidine kinase [Agromyces archimandritae]QTX04562.1 sensor domain-containing protein [Agromyces archimandritae]